MRCRSTMLAGCSAFLKVVHFWCDAVRFRPIQMNSAEKALHLDGTDITQECVCVWTGPQARFLSAGEMHPLYLSCHQDWRLGKIQHFKFIRIKIDKKSSNRDTCSGHNYLRQDFLPFWDISKTVALFTAGTTMPCKQWRPEQLPGWPVWCIWPPAVQLITRFTGCTE